MNPSDQSNTKASPTEMEPTAPSPQNAEVAEGQMAKATATAGRPTPSPNQDIPQAAPSLSAPSTELDSSCTATGTANGSSVLKVKEEPIDETMMNPEADKRHTQIVMASNFSTFLTPSPLADGAKNNGTKPKKELMALKTEQQECERFSPPKGQMSFPGSESAMPSSAEFTLSNFSFSNGDGSCGLLSDPFVDTPDPASTSSSIDFNSFGREFNGSSAPTLSYRPPFDLDTSGEFSSFHGANNASGPVDMSQYSMVDQFALPPYLQAHLDETYAASTLIFPNNPQDHDARSGNVVFQVTAYRPRSSAPGTTPPAICRSSERESRANYNDENKENVNPAAVAVNRPNQNCKAAATAAAAAAAASSKSKSTRNKPRPLPLRKRPLNQDSPVQKKRATRMQDPAPSENNVEEEEEKDRLVCRCAKSKCLKLYCDCFQRGKICIGRCSCTNCKNTEANSGPNGIRTKTIREILERRPDAFERRGKRTGEGCSCKKNK